MQGYEKYIYCPEKLRDYFPITLGVQQGNSLFFILFSMFTNHQAMALKNAEAGIKKGNIKLGTLMSAGDVLIAADTHTESLSALNIMI